MLWVTFSHETDTSNIQRNKAHDSSNSLESRNNSVLSRMDCHDVVVTRVRTNCIYADGEKLLVKVISITKNGMLSECV